MSISNPKLMLLSKQHFIKSALSIPFLFLSLFSTTTYSQTLEEVVVTAQKREENLQSTPVSISAFSSDRLTELDIGDPQTLADFVPNLV